MAYGAIPIRVLGGVRGPIVNSMGIQWTIATGYATAIAQGDFVKQINDGTLQRAAAGDVNIIGVFAGVSYKASDGSIVYSKTWPASTSATEIKAYVYDDPKTVFQIESDQDTTALASNSVGENADIVVAAANSLGISGMSLDSSTKTASTAQLRILGSAETDGSFTSAGTTMDVYVLINEHLFASTTGI